MELFINGTGILKAENGKYYITDDEWEVYKKVNKNDFIKELNKYAYVCLTSWDKELKKQYLDLVDYVNNCSLNLHKINRW